jgi:hypothetical protein
MVGRRPLTRAEQSSPTRRFRISLRARRRRAVMEAGMNNIIYIVGLIVIVMAVLSLLGLR